MSIRNFGFHLLAIVSLLSTAGAVTVHHRRTHVRRSHHPVRHVRRVVWNPMFPGSHEMLVEQNEELDRLELPRIADEQELIALEQADELVPVEDSRSLVVAPDLAETHRYCKPWTRDFLTDLSDAYYRQFHTPIVVTSLVRTIEQQRKLRRYNSNAAPEEGDTASTHLTGVTVDILKRGMTRSQHRWLEQYFLPLKEEGLIDPIEERRQPVFHIVVHNTYGDSEDPEIPVSAPQGAPELPQASK